MSPSSSFAPLPVDLSSFVGREDELARLEALLPDTRLLTLTGPGGGGKTRLALELVRRASRDQPVLWVELASTADPAAVPARLGLAMGLDADTAKPDLLAERLPDRVLVALDNCEHLLDAAADLVEALLKRHPGVTVVATSREPLGVPGERAWLAPPLSLPGDGRSEAVALFVERAREGSPSFQLTSANRDAVETICRELDGIPLAIELAAARIRLLTPGQIRDRLHEALDLLSRGGRTAIPRHRTLRATLDWSHALLDGPTAALFRRLGVFRGGASLEGVETVGQDDDGTAALGTLDALGRLVDRSLVTVREQDAVARYHLLETVRRYALERLAEAGETEAIRGRHARFVTAMVEEARPHFTGPERRSWVDRLTPELPNLRGALEWTLEHDPELHVRLAESLWWFWFSSRHWTEARRWLQGALALKEASCPDRRRAGLLFAMGALEALQGRSLAARPPLEEALTLASAVEDPRLEAYVRVYLGMTFAQEKDPRAEGHLEPARAWLEEEGDLYLLRLAQILLGSAYANRGDMTDALEITRAGVATARAFGADRELGISLQALAILHWQAGETEAAEPLLLESLAALERDPSLMFVARSLHFLALCRAMAGRSREAVRLLASAEATRAGMGVSVVTLDAGPSAPVVAELRAALDPADFEAAWKEGAEAELPTVLAEVLGEAGKPAPTLPGEPVPPPVGPEERAGVGPAGVRTTQVPDLRIRLLGPVEVELQGTTITDDAWPYARPRELLALMALHPEGLPRARISEAMWPDAGPAQAKNSVHVTLHHLRKVFGRSEWIELRDDRYRFADGLTVEVDAARFERVARDTGASADEMKAALALYRGDLLADETVGGWVDEHADRLRRLRRDLVLRLGEALEREGREAEAESHYQTLALREELDEVVHRRLMLLWARRGERARAIEHFGRLADLLRTELEAEPEPATLELLSRIQAGAA